MKRVLLLGCILLITTVCTVTKPNTAASKNAPSVVSAPSDCGTAYADFSARLSAALIDGTQNRSLSPVSVYLTLSMVAEGAKGETQDALLRLLGCDRLEQMRNVCSNMLLALSADSDGSTIDLHNSLWMARSVGGSRVVFRDAFLSVLAESYRSEAGTINFGNPSAAKRIAKRIARHTRGKLQVSPDALNLGSDTLAVLISTIYFKDQWAESFDPQNTEEGTFFGLDPKTRQLANMPVDYMHRVDDHATITQGDGWLRYRVSFKKIGYMTFVLPDEGVPLRQLLGSPDALRTLLTEGTDRVCSVSLRIPKFSFQNTMDLKDTLQSLGLAHCFSDGDFSGITDAPFAINSVLHGTYIGVDETSAEAASFTFFSAPGAAPTIQNERIEFHLTRPFLYAIESHDGTVLFIGAVTAPLAGA